MAAKTVYVFYRRHITEIRIDTTRAMIGENIRSHLSVFSAMVSFAARWNIGDAPVNVFFPLTMIGNTVADGILKERCFLVSPVHFRHVSGMSLVYLWYVSGMSLVCLWYVSGMSLLNL